MIATHQNLPSTWHVRPVNLTSHLSGKDQVAWLQPGMQFPAHPQSAGGAPELLFTPDPSALATQSSLVVPTITVLASTLYAVCPPAHLQNRSCRLIHSRSVTLFANELCNCPHPTLLQHIHQPGVGPGAIGSTPRLMFPHHLSYMPHACESPPASPGWVL